MFCNFLLKIGQFRPYILATLGTVPPPGLLLFYFLMWLVIGLDHFGEMCFSYNVQPLLFLRGCCLGQAYSHPGMTVVLAGLPFWVCLFLDLSLKLLACLPLFISPQQLASTNFWLIALLFSTMSWVTNFFTFLFRPFFRSNTGAQTLSPGILTPGGFFLCLFPCSFC